MNFYLSSKSRKIMVLLFAFIISSLTKDMFLFNTSDFYRSTEGIMEAIPTFDFNLSLNYKLLDTFIPFYNSYYKSSFSMLIYIYSVIISTITNTFDMRIYAFIFKVIYVFCLYSLFCLTCKNHKKQIFFLFFAICIPMISSSNIGMFSSLYQEQVVLFSLPLTIVFLMKDGWVGILGVFVFSSIIACSKGQFFYFPLLAAVYYLIYSREFLVQKILMCLISLSLSLLCIYSTADTSQYNKYHSTYFGVYELMHLNNMEIPEGVDKNCVGVDSWGKRFDLMEGATYTEIDEKCRLKHLDVKFQDSLYWFLKNPLHILTLPFDKGVRTQLSEDYFHVFKSLKLARNDDNFTKQVTLIKDYIFKEVRFSILSIFLLLSLILFRAKESGFVFLISSFGVSQLYISFLGEGYRDMAKHLFAMNFSFDLLVFLSLCFIINKISSR